MPRPYSALHGRVFHRKRKAARPTDYEKDLIAKFVKDQGGSITDEQVSAMGYLLRRPRKTMKKLIEEARTKFISRASRMVDTYFQATEGALKDGQFDVASKSAQWYIQNVSSEG